MKEYEKISNNNPSSPSSPFSPSSPLLKKILCSVLFVLFAINTGTLKAMNWPSEDAVLIRNFGVNDSGIPVLGMVFSGGTSIRAAERGEIVFTRSKNDSASRLPSPLGAWMAVDHGDGLISIYSRYADRLRDDSHRLRDDSHRLRDDSHRLRDDSHDYRSESEPAGTVNLESEYERGITGGILSRDTIPFYYVEKNQRIAHPGISGWSSRDGFNFMIIDRRERRWVNPAMIITPPQRLRNPQIHSIELKNAQGQTVQSFGINQGRYTVHVNTVSPPLVAETQGIVLVPQRITCLVNGAETASLNFESFSARDGTLMVYRNGLVPARQIYSAFPSFEASEVFLTRGQATLEIIVQDITGNSVGSVMRFSVN